MYVLEIPDGRGRLSFRQEEQSEIVVGVAVRWCNGESPVEFFLRQVGLPRRSVEVGQIDMCLDRFGVECQGTFESGQRAIVLVLAATNNSEQIVSINAGGVCLEELLRSGLRFRQLTLLNQRFCRPERGILGRSARLGWLRQQCYWYSNQKGEQPSAEILKRNRHRMNGLTVAF